MSEKSRLEACEEALRGIIADASADPHLRLSAVHEMMELDQRFTMQEHWKNVSGGAVGQAGHLRGTGGA